MQCRSTQRSVRTHKQAITLLAALAAIVWLAQTSVTRGDDPPAGVSEQADAPAAAKDAVVNVPEPSVEFLPVPSAAEQRVLDALARPVSLEFVEKPLAAVAASIDGMLDHQISIQLDNRALEDAGVGSDTPITRTVSNVTLKVGLKLLLDDLDLTYVVQDGVLLVTTVDVAETPDRLSTRVYPVGDLVNEVYDPLVGVIAASVQPSSWNRVGGNASIEPMATCKSLVIAQTLSGHENVLELLRALRAAKKVMSSHD